MRLAMNTASALAPAQKTCRRVSMPVPSKGDAKMPTPYYGAGRCGVYVDHPDVTDATRFPAAPRARYFGANSWFGKLEASGTLMTMNWLPVVVWHALHPAVIFP